MWLLLNLHGAEGLGFVVQRSLTPDRRKQAARRSAEEEVFFLAIVLLHLVACEVVGPREVLATVFTLGKTVFQ